MKVKTNGMAARSYAFSQNQFENIIFKDILMLTYAGLQMRQEKGVKAQVAVIPNSTPNSTK